MNIGPEDHEKAAEIIRAAQIVGGEVYRQMTKQGVDNPVANIAGLEIAAKALEEADAPTGARLGSISMYAHRIFQKDFSSTGPHLYELCEICSIVEQLKDIEQ